MANHTIRKAVLSDLSQVQDLNHKLFESDLKHFNDLNTEWPYQKEGEEYFKKRINEKDGVCFVAEVDGQVVGYVAGGWSHLNFSAYKGKRAELENIYVDVEYQRLGIGAALVDKLYKWFKEQGATHIMVDTSVKNQNAISFYHNTGFEDYSNTLWRTIE